MKERFLPIGTVVLLKDATSPLMITSYCVYSKNDASDSNQKKEVFEYGACSFPEGVLDPEKVFVFNHNQIKEILYPGYENDAQKEFARIISENYDKVKEDFESGKLTEEDLKGNN